MLIVVSEDVLQLQFYVSALAYNTTFACRVRHRFRACPAVSYNRSYRTWRSFLVHDPGRRHHGARATGCGNMPLTCSTIYAALTFISQSWRYTRRLISTHRGSPAFTLATSAPQARSLDPNLVLDGADARWDASHDTYIFTINVRYSTSVKLCSRGMWSHNWFPHVVEGTRKRDRCVTVRVTSAYTNFQPKARLLDFSGFRQL